MRPMMRIAQVLVVVGALIAFGTCGAAAAEKALYVPLSGIETRFDVVEDQYGWNDLRAAADGSVWFKTEHQIGRLFPNGQFQILPIEPQFASGFAVGRESGVFASLQSARLAYIEPSGSVTPIALWHAAPDASIGGIVADDFHSIWVTLQESYGDNASYSALRVGPTGFVTRFRLEDQEEALIVGRDGHAYRSGLYGNIVRLTDRGPVDTGWLNQGAFNVASDGSLWTGGLFIVTHFKKDGSKEGLQIERWPSVFSSLPRVNSLAIADDQSVWLSFHNLLCRVRDMRLACDDRKEFIAGVTAASDGAIWFVQGRSIIRYVPN